MITKRLLRLALGPSYLEEVDKNEFLKKNEQQVDRLHIAESQILVYVGLSDSKPKGSNSDDTEEQYLPEEGESDQDLGLFNGSSSHPTSGPQRDNLVSQDIGEGDYDDENLSYIPVGLVHLLYMVCPWPATKALAKAQVFTLSGTSSAGVAGYAGLWRNRGLRGLYRGFEYSSLFDVASQLCIQLTRQSVLSIYKLLGKVVSPRDSAYAFAPLDLLVALGIDNIVATLLTYPLFEHSIYHMLDLGPLPVIPLTKMYTLSYFRASAKLIANVCMLKAVEDKVRSALEIYLSDYVKKICSKLGPTDIRKRFRIVPFFADLFSSTLAEILMIPLSQRVYRVIALKYGCSRLELQPSISTIATAVLVQWSVTWIFAKIHEWVCYSTLFNNVDTDDECT